MQIVFFQETLSEQMNAKDQLQVLSFSLAESKYIKIKDVLPQTTLRN